MKKFFLIVSILIILVFGVIIRFNYKKYMTENELLGIFIDGNEVSDFPKKGESLFLSSSCDGNASAEWDNDNWGLYVTDLSKKSKCNIYFQNTLGGSVRTLAKEDNINLASDDVENNIRYIGSNPDNYVYFNCSDYSNQSDDTCEKWRIIGLFNSITKSDGTKENLVKIIRSKNIGEYSWDNKNSNSGAETEYGSNDWTTARLNYLLNPNHDNEIIGDSLYYNAKSGNCYKGKNGAFVECDFTSTGLKNSQTRDIIENVVWNIGGVKEYIDDTNGLAKHWYEMERGMDVYSGGQQSGLEKLH